MSESDDTDILLLIPPDYFLNSIEEQEQLPLREWNRKRQQEHQLAFSLRAMSAAESNLNLKGIAFDYNGTSNEQNKKTADELAMPPPTLPSTTAAYKFLSPEKKKELNAINSRLYTLAQHDDFVAPSDISTISSNTVRTRATRGDLFGLVHSTPKCNELPYGQRANERRRQQRDHAHEDVGDGGVLQEIDYYFGARDREDEPYRQSTAYWNRHSEPRNIAQHNDAAEEEHATSLPNAISHLSLENPSHATVKPKDSNLISLSEIWGKSGQNTAIVSGVTQSALREEQLRRQHLEKTVHLLQSRLLEYQQRLSVAIEVDRAKDDALNNAQSKCNSLHLEAEQLREVMQKYITAQKDYQKKLELLQHELTQAVSMASRLQEKNEKLELELAASSKKTNEFNSKYKEQVQELEFKLHACKRSEEFAITESNNFKDKSVKAEYQCEKLKIRCEELEKDNNTLKQQKETLQELQQKQKIRADALEAQKKSLQDTLKQQNDAESALKRKFEMQQKSLKSHYQQQLENVVSQKMKEFQTQLDKTEETLRSESRERERLIAERAVKQLELINEKNEIELNLLQEKHDEEISLYRIQLASASNKIDELDVKLHSLKSKRADIAEKLHDVMETQWQKALEILISPNQSKQMPVASDANSPDSNEGENKLQNGQFETPKSRKTAGTDQRDNKENNLNVENQKEQPAPMDRLQAYIELLLSKSPSDFEKLDEILALSKKSRPSNSRKLGRSASKRLCNGRPPWKA